MAAEQIRLDAEQIPVPAGVVKDRLDTDPLLDEQTDRLRAHSRRSPWAVGHVDGVDARLVTLPRLLQNPGGVGAAGRIDRHRDHETLGELAREARLLLPWDGCRRLPGPLDDAHLDLGATGFDHLDRGKKILDVSRRRPAAAAHEAHTCRDE